MEVGIIAGPQQQEAWLNCATGAGINCRFYTRVQDVPAGVDAVFDLEFTPEAERLAALTALLPATVFVNSICHTLNELRQPFIRINAWPGFLNRNLHEIAVAGEAAAQQAATVLENLGWTYKIVPDIPGLVTPRVIAMIVNEAFYALGEGVSTRNEIDVAMKLGTGYPAGPFEWADQIGLRRIYQLLTTLGQTSPRYTIAPALAKAAEQA